MLTVKGKDQHVGCTLLLRGTADGEGVPFILGYNWYVDVDIVSRFELEERWPLDHQMSYL